ncbi:MAG TPA: ATP-dependent helicase, partial [Mycobacteriales bacterium]|nr:ATP-dependent helicase [Mycobacteriales bacterium]
MSALPAEPSFGLADLGRLLGRPPSDEQAAIVTSPLEPRVVVAGAGSGKTATMVARVVWLVARGEVPPDGVLGLTFTTKAADELATRVRRALRDLARVRGEPPPDAEPAVSTYHAYAARLVRDHGLRVGCEPGARLVTPATSWQLASRAVGTYDGPMDAVSWAAERTVVGAVLHLAGELSEHLRDADDVRAAGARLQALADAAPDLPADGRKVLACRATREQLLPVVEAYARLKRERGLLDFGDVVALAARVAQAAPEVAAAERAAFPLVLLDEYQDTGGAQELLLSSLFRGHAVTAVGDPCQSIYGWRGASAGTLRRFPERFAGRDARPLALSTTYRNGGRVLRLANAASDELRREGVPVPALRPAPGREQDGEVRVALHPDVDTEAAWVAAEVEAAVRALGPRSGEGGDGRLWSQGAVLCRKRAQFPRLRAAFEARGVPVEVVGLGGLLDVPEVADVVATLQVLDDPAAGAPLLRLLTGPRWRLGPRDLVALGRHARRLAGRPEPGSDPVDAVVRGVDETAAGSLVDALDDLPPEGLSEEGRRRLTALRDELRALRRRADQPLPDLVADVERTLGLDVEVAARPRADDPLAARADLDAFADAAASFAGDVAQDGAGEAVLSAFLAHLAAVREEEAGGEVGTTSGADTVKLMTVHAAKGLEWAVVAVPGLARSTDARGGAVFPARPKEPTAWTANPRLLPFDLRGDAADLPTLRGLDKQGLRDFAEQQAARDAREERRLFYVAVTRAERVLLCSGYHWGEGRSLVGPSEFLLEARAACEDGAGTVGPWADEAPEENPVTTGERVVAWPSPAPPAGRGAQAAAARVRALLAGDDAPPPALSGDAARLVASWDDDLRRLAEEQRRAAARRSTAVLPGSLSVSRLVDLRRDPEALALSLVRPLPRRPFPAARRGTAFHAWLESDVYGAPQLLDEAELPGSADATAAGLPELAALQ